MQEKRRAAQTPAATPRANPSLTAAPEKSETAGSPSRESAVQSAAAANAAATHAWYLRSGGAGVACGLASDPGGSCRCASSAGPRAGPSTPGVTLRTDTSLVRSSTAPAQRVTAGRTQATIAGPFGM